MKVPFAVVKIGGESFRELKLWEMTDAVVFDEGADKMDRVTVRMSMKHGGEFSKDIFKHGADAELAIGYKDDVVSVFTGLVKTLQPTFPDSQAPGLTWEAFDYSILMVAERWHAFQNRTIGGVAKEVAKGYPSIKKVEVDEPEMELEKNEQLFNQSKTDREFLRELAKWVGYRFHLTKDTLYFKKLEKEEDLDALVYRPHAGDEGLVLKSFTPRTDIEGIVSGIRILNETPRNIEDVDANTREIMLVLGLKGAHELCFEIFGERASTYFDRKPKDQNEAKQAAAAKLSEESLKFMSGNGDLQEGCPYLRAGQIRELKLRGLPTIDEEFNGDYLITDTTHTISDRGYDTRFDIRRNALGKKQ